VGAVYTPTYGPFYTGATVTDSLLLTPDIELLGGAVSAIPACAGAIFRLTTGYSLDAPQPTAGMVASMLDGERPTGARDSNRNPSLPIVILGTTRAMVAAGREVLVRAVSQPHFTLTWTREGGLPFVLDCYKANAAVVEYDLKRDKSPQSGSIVGISFTAQPFGRSDVPTVVEFPTPLAGQSAPPPAVLIDDFSTGLPTGLWTQSLIGPGPFSAFWNSGTSGVGLVASLTRAGLGPLNLTGLNGLRIDAGFGSSTWFKSWGLIKAGPVQFAFTLSDGTHSATVHVTKRIKMSSNTYQPVWQTVRVPVPTGSGLNLAAITGYTLKVSSRAAGDLLFTEVYLGSFKAVPYAVPLSAISNNGVVYDLAGIAGSARSPFSLQIQQPAGSVQQVTKRFTTPGAFNWLCPPGCTEIAKVSLVGGGGRGATTTGSVNAGGGGGGAEFVSEAGLRVTPGNVYPGQVASGGSSGSGTGGDSTFAADGITARAHGGANVANAATAGGAGGAGYSRQERLSGDTATFEGGIANWTGAGNAGVVQSAAFAHSGTKSLKVTAVATANMIAASCSPANVMTQGEGCDPSQPVFLSAFTRAGVTPRTSYVGAEFYDINGLSLGQFFGAGVADSAANYLTNPTATITPPAGAGSGRLRRLVKWDSPLAGEDHYVDDWSLQEGVQHDGGAGGAGNTTPSSTGAGGGGSGGPTGSGGAGGTGASGGAGGAAGSGGQPSAAGGRGAIWTPFVVLPQPGFAPGGGGGGGVNGIGGGNGAHGEVDLWYNQSAPFKTAVVHRPGFDAVDTFCPFVPMNSSDTPDGTTEYQIPMLIAGSPARFGSHDKPFTVTVYLVSASWHNPSAARTVTATIRQYEQAGGTVYPVSVSRSVTPNNLASPLVLLGELTLPDHAMPDDNTQAYFTVSPTSTDTADRLQDCLLLDTLGSTVIIESPTAYTSYWVDEPPPTVDLGNIMGSQFDRPDAVSVLAYATVSGPPLHVSPFGNQSLLCYVADTALSAPSAEIVHYPRWMLERLPV